MILYHFTTIKLIRPDMTPGPAVIPPEGLVGGKAEGQAGGVFDTVGVWLTTDPVPGQSDPGSNCVRITVKIPTTDRKLTRFARHPMADLVASLGEAFSPLAADLSAISAADALTRMRRDWWFYWGAIRPTRWVDIEILNGQCPWWLSVRLS
jgi:hypothetical protein